MKKRVSLILTLAAITLAFALPQAANAQENYLLPTCINNNSDVRYHYINDILSFDAHDDLYFSDTSGLFKSSKRLSDAVLATTFYQDKMLTCQDLGIFYNQTLILSGEFSNIVVLGNNLYAADQDIVYMYNISLEEDSITLEDTNNSYQFSDRVQDMCATSAAVYVKLFDSNSIHKIYGASSGVVEEEVERLVTISAHPSSPLLFCLTNLEALSFEDTGDMLSRKSHISAPSGEKLTVGLDRVFIAISDGGTYSILQANHALDSLSGFIASRGEYDYFFRSPLGISTRYGSIYVADTNNNRICVLTQDKVDYITHYEFGEDSLPYYKPKSAALSLSGELFISHQNKLTNHSTGKTLELKDEQKRSLSIEKMVIDTNGNIYVLGVHSVSKDSFVYLVDTSLTSFSLLEFDHPSALGYKAGGEVLVYDDSIKNLKGEVIANSSLLIDFCLDYNGKVFGINLEHNLISIDNDTVINHGGSYDRVTLSNVAGELCDYGDVLLVDSSTSSLLKISAAVAGVADVSKQFERPNIEADNNAHVRTENFVATVKNDTPLFDQPSEAVSSTVLEKGFSVFIRYDIDAPEDMYFVVAERTTEVEEIVLIGGYLYRSALGTFLEYVMPPKNTAKVHQDVGIYGYIYKYPSLKANHISQVVKGDWVKPLDFATNKLDIDSDNCWYEDILLNKWVRVLVGENEGYMLELGLSWSLFSDSVSEPNTNATIKNNAPLYVYNAQTQKYEFLDGQYFLEKGKRVEVKTPFDSSSRYTMVVFSIETDGETEVIDIECFVETKHIDFDGVDVLQIIAIVAIIACVILAIFLTIWIIRKRMRAKFNISA